MYVLQPILVLCINHPTRFCSVRIIFCGSSSTLAPSTDDESESEGCWLHPGVSPPGDAVLQLDDESNSVLESGCMSSRLKLLHLKEKEKEKTG